jgi:energy-coupling factor transporter ATP-binding protein EcfA2
VIRIRNISLGRGSRMLLRDASAAISPGERIALIGDNGSGKSTLLGARAGEIGLDRRAGVGVGIRVGVRVRVRVGVRVRVRVGVRVRVRVGVGVGVGVRVAPAAVAAGRARVSGDLRVFDAGGREEEGKGEEAHG